MKKKLIIIGILAALIITGGIISGVWDRTTYYEITEENGQHYIVTDPDWLNLPLACTQSKWKNVKKAKKEIVSGKIPLTYVINLLRIDYGTNAGKIRIIDPDLICELQLPNGYRCKSFYYNNNSLTYQLSGHNINKVHIAEQYVSADDFLAERAMKLIRNREKTGSTQVFSKECDGYSITTVNNSENYELHRDYSVTNGMDILHISEKYILCEGEIMNITGDNSPDVDFYGISNGIQFYGHIESMEKEDLWQLKNTFALLPIN